VSAHYSVVWTRSAVDDLLHIVDDVAARDGTPVAEHLCAGSSCSRWWTADVISGNC